MLIITPIYVGLLALLTIFLAIRVSRAREAHKVSVGDGDNPALLKAIRVHANTAEYVPLALVVLVVIELQGAPVMLLHGLGALLLVGRILHAYGLGSKPQVRMARMLGAMATLIMVIVSALAALWLALT